MVNTARRLEDLEEPPRPRPRRRRRRKASEERKPHAVIIVENMTVPPDRRVWQEAKALREAGWRVSVITPKVGAYRDAYEVIDGIAIHRHPLPLEARGVAAYAAEYSAALAFEARALWKIGLDDIDVVQICNPPDFLFLPALLAKKFGRAKVVFDQHDLTPALLAEKTGRAKGPLIAFARWAERRTFAAADRVISTNSALRDRAIAVGEKAEGDVSVVYSSPDLTALPDARPDHALKRGAETLILWVGVMGSQDGVDLLLETAAKLRGLPGGASCQFLIAGDGPERAAMEEMARDIGVDSMVTFAGFLHGEALATAFATADIGVGSDPKNPFNDRLAMNKVMEYMAWRLPMALFDLQECRKIAGAAALYAANNDPAALAANLSNLIQSPELRRKMGARGFARLEREYGWEQQKTRYTDVFEQLRHE